MHILRVLGLAKGNCTAPYNNHFVQELQKMQTSSETSKIWQATTYFSLTALTALVLMTWAVTPNQAVGACPTPDGQFPYIKDVEIPFYEDLPFKVVTKRWSTSAETKSYFDLQKELLNYHRQQGIETTSTATASVAVLGDLMRIPPNHDEFVSDAANAFLSSHDMVFGNLETLIANSYPNPPRFFFQMNSDPALVTAFNRPDGSSLFTALSTANNHTYDYPDQAILETLEFLDQQGIPHSGVQRSEDEPTLVIVENNGFKVGFYATTTFVNQAGRLEDTELFLNRLQGLRPVPNFTWLPVCELDFSHITAALEAMEAAEVDLKIINIHWGYEYEMYPQPLQMQITRELVAAGADIIIGAHPHVPQPAEICYVNGAEQQLPEALRNKQSNSGCNLTDESGEARKALIYYSLGNFTSAAPMIWQQFGTLGRFELSKDTSGKVDWFSPDFEFFYSDMTTSNILKADRNLYLLDEYLENNCLSESCPDDILNSAETLENHHWGPSLTTAEEIQVIWQNVINAVREMLL